MLPRSILQDAVVSSISIKTETSTREDGGFWSGFPEDLIVEVLSRLPKKDLITLKFVSKDWNFVISRICIPKLCPPYHPAPLWALLCFKDALPSPDVLPDKWGFFDKFLKFHFLALYQHVYRREVFPPRFFGDRIEDCFLSMLPKEVEEECDPSNIRDCCNGLLLLASPSTSRYYVANPVTKQRLLIPNNSQCRDNASIKSIHSSLVFDPSLSVEFKIVSFIRPAEHATVSVPMELNIFCSEAGRWSSHVLPLEPHGLYGFEWLRRSVYHDRSLYSLSLAMHLVCIDNLIPTSNSISKNCGDLDVNAWAIELPDKYLIPNELLPHCCGCIGASSGSFYYSNRDVEGSSMLVWMLVLKGKNSEWVLIHSISIADDLVPMLSSSKQLRHWKKFDCFRPRAFLPKDDILVIAAPKLVVAYHLKTKLVDDIWIPTPYNSWRCNRKSLHLDGNWVFPFSPCLLLLNNIAAENRLME